jgi:hypothetical protein
MVLTWEPIPEKVIEWIVEGMNDMVINWLVE